MAQILKGLRKSFSNSRLSHNVHVVLDPHAHADTTSAESSATTDPERIEPVNDANAPVYKHTSTFYGTDMTMTVRSPHIELTWPESSGGRLVNVPTFGLRDSVSGTITLNPESCPNSPQARLVVSIEGALIYTMPSATRHRRSAPATPHKHVFLFSSHTIPFGATSPRAKTRTNSLAGNVREVLRRTLSTNGPRRKSGPPVAGQRGRRGSNASETLKGAASALELERTHSLGASKSAFAGPTSTVGGAGTGPAAGGTVHPFFFHIPFESSTHACPPSFTTIPDGEGDDGPTASSHDMEGHLRDARTEYRITARWESGLFKDMCSEVVAPLDFEPGTTNKSYYALPRKEEIKFSETLLKSPSLAPPPFKCHLTLPTPRVFSRDSTITYYVAFTASDSFKPYARELASGAIITLALQCHYWIDPAQEVAATVSGRTLEWKLPPRSPLARRQKERSGIQQILGDPTAFSSAPQPPPPFLDTLRAFAPPAAGTSEPTAITQTLWAETFTGFPNRPKQRPGSPSSGGSSQSGPDHLRKGKMTFTTDMLPSMEWPGMSVKYSISATVRLGESDEVSTKVDIRLVEPYINRAHTSRAT